MENPVLLYPGVPGAAFNFFRSPTGTSPVIVIDTTTGTPYYYIRDVGFTAFANGGGGGSGNSVSASVDFGASFTDSARTVVTGQAWVEADSDIVGQVLTPSGTDPDEMRLLDMRVVISDIVAGVGFTVTVYCEAEAKGTYTVACIGV